MEKKKPTDFACSKANHLGEILQPGARKRKRNFGEHGTEETQGQEGVAGELDQKLVLNDTERTKGRE